MTKDATRNAVWLCMVVFFVQPFHFGIWLSRVAEVQSDLALSKSDLAIGLLGMPIGLLPSLYIAGRAVDRIGPRKAMIWAFPPMLAAGILPGLATGLMQLFFALFIFGAVFAFAEVSLNVFAARTEKAVGKAIMNRAHGFWSLGVMAGSFTGVQLASAGYSVPSSLQIAGLGLLPVLLIVTYSLPHIDAVVMKTTKPMAAPPIPKALFLIVAIVFGATIVEGAMIDWAAVYMHEVAQIVAGKEGLAVTVFSGFMTVGRFAGDSINMRFGPTFLARLCLGSAVVGLMVLVADLGYQLSFIGFALVGLGVSTVFPLGISASAAQSKGGEARNVSIMTFGALSGFLIGPPMIGFMAEATSLNAAFGLLLPGVLLSFLLARRLTVN